MRNIKLTIAYDGSGYAGWQIQAHKTDTLLNKAVQLSKKTKRLTTVQGEIQKALQKILRKKVDLIGSGRTDAGVHALGQIANFKTDRPFELDKLVRSLNGILPENISVVKAQEVDFDFHARFNAKSRTYRYLIVNSPFKPAFIARKALWVRQSLDVALMAFEAKVLTGRHDFKSFQAKDHIERDSCVTMTSIKIRSMRGDGIFPLFWHQDVIVVDLTADRFLRSMVRNIVGTLIEIGRGKIKKGQLERILFKKDRRLAGPCVTGCGLYLLKVRYE